MQYTLRNIPADVDRALRQEAHERRKSLNQVAIEALRRSVVGGEVPRKRRDLSDITGTWQEDSHFDAALKAQDRVEPEMWE